MITEVLILAAGKGSKFWPYQSTRNKTLIPISNTPLLMHSVSTLLQAQINHVVIVSTSHTDSIKHVFRKHPEVDVLHLEASKGSADSFSQGIVKLHHPDHPFLVLQGDCLVQPDDLHDFLKQGLIDTVLVSPLREPASHWIACSLDQGSISAFGGHHRGTAMTHQMVAFITDGRLKNVCDANPGRFTNLKVGVGSPEESYLEVSLMDWMTDGHLLKAIETKEPVFDIDKPWHALSANAWMNAKRCGQLSAHELAEGALIDPSARLDGFVRLGKNSRIGKNVWIRGNVIIGDNTILDQGVVIGANVVIGDHCSLLNHAKLGEGTTLGHRCMMDQGFEVLSGLIMDHVYLVHYGEYYGMIGENTDLGAGTTCGTLRFDDGLTVQNIKGHREMPANFANASYMGDNSRTGVCAILMPGVKIGTSCVVGSGVILYEDLADNTLVYAKQDLVKTGWGPNKYGW